MLIAVCWSDASDASGASGASDNGDASSCL